MTEDNRRRLADSPTAEDKRQAERDLNAPMTDDEVESEMGLRRDENGYWVRDDIGVTPAEDNEGVYLVRASDLEPEHVDYLDQDLIPLRVTTLVVGIDGVGKSTLLYSKAALATQGKLPGACEGTAVAVVVASSEDHANSVIVPRLMAAGADLDQVHIVKVRRDGLTGDIALPDDLDEVAAEVATVNARLLIVDPLVAHMPTYIDSHKAQHVRRVLAPLAHLAEERLLAVAAVVHFNAVPSTDVRSRISGSKALRDASRSVLVCGVDPEDESRFVMVQDKNSFGPRPTTGHAYRIETRHVEHKGETYTTSAMVWLGEVNVTSRQLLAGPSDEDEAVKLEEARTFLRDYFTDAAHETSLPVEDVEVAAEDVKAAAKNAGIADRTLDRARTKERITSHRRGFGAGAKYVWRAASPCSPTPPDEDDFGGRGEHAESLPPQGEAAPDPPHARQPHEAGGHGGNHDDDPFLRWARNPGVLPSLEDCREAAAVSGWAVRERGADEGYGFDLVDQRTGQPIEGCAYLSLNGVRAALYQGYRK